MVVKLTSASAEDAQYFVFNMIATDFCNILEYRIFLDAIQNQYIGIGFSFFVKAWPGRITQCLIDKIYIFKNARAWVPMDFMQDKYSAPRTIEKIKILEAVLELPAKQHCQSSPFNSKLGQIGQIGSAV